MKRRQFLILGTAGLLASTSARVFSNDVRTRPSLTDAVSDPIQLKALRDGFQALRNNKDLVDQAISWRFQAAVHAVPRLTGLPPGWPAWKEELLDRAALSKATATTRSYWNRCDHGFDHADGFAPHFLSWHRMYLFYFEETLRTLSKNDDFMLPYWDSVRDARLPEVMWKDKTDANSLYLKYRGTAANKGEAVGVLDDEAIKTSETLQELNAGLESMPHNNAHSFIGGAMGDPRVAALDPIFWFHHANIDRLWWQWQATHGKINDGSLPSDWDETSYSFLTASGAKQNKVAEFLDTESKGYTYGPPSKLTTPATAPAPKLPPLIATGKATSLLGGNKLFVLSGSEKPLRLTQASGTVRLPFSTSSKKKLGTLSLGNSKIGTVTSATLLLQGVTLTHAGEKEGFQYEVYVNLPTSPTAIDTKDRYLIGRFGPWEMNCINPAVCTPGGGRTFRFPMTSRLLQQTQGKPAALSSVDISFVRVGAVDVAGKTLDLPTKEALVEVKSVQVLVSEGLSE